MAENFASLRDKSHWHSILRFAILLGVVGLWTTSAAQAELIARYTFDDGTATDQTGNGLDGTLHGNAMIEAAADTSRGMVLVLGDMENDTVEGSTHVAISDPTGLLDFGADGPHQGSASVAAWVFNDSPWTNHDPILNQGEWRNGIGLNIKPDDMSHLWAGCEAPGCSANTSVNSDTGVPADGAWYHVAATWAYDDAANTTLVTFYLNAAPLGYAATGVLDGVMPGRVTSPVDNDGDGVGDTRIGLEWRDATLTNIRWPFSGSIDDLQIYDEALDQAGIEQAMAGNIGEPLIPGDTNGNGIGGEFPDDFDPIRDNFRMVGASRTEGDLVRNGVVDFRDFQQWKTEFLSAGGSLADLDFGFLSSVPEPGSIAILLPLALVSFCRRGIRADARKLRY